MLESSEVYLAGVSSRNDQVEKIYLATSSATDCSASQKSSPKIRV